VRLSAARGGSDGLRRRGEGHEGGGLRRKRQKQDAYCLGVMARSHAERRQPMLKGEGAPGPRQGRRTRGPGRGRGATTDDGEGQRRDTETPPISAGGAGVMCAWGFTVARLTLTNGTDWDAPSRASLALSPGL
jgi:hypothetical protein